MSETFLYHGTEIPYFDHLYNLTHLNERRVEIAVARHWMDSCQWFRSHSGLEVGNVLGHYFQMENAVIDRDESAAWYQSDDALHQQQIINTDIFDFMSDKVLPGLFGWGVSISTVEHTVDPLRAIHIIKSLLVPGSPMLVTFPMGEHEDLDRLVLWDGPETVFDRYCTLVRSDENGHWEQTPEPQWRQYGPWANSVFIGEWTAPA